MIPWSSRSGVGLGANNSLPQNKIITETEDLRNSINIGKATRAYSSRMTHFVQSRKETQKPTDSIVNPKPTARIGNWNVVWERKSCLNSKRDRKI